LRYFTYSKCNQLYKYVSSETESNYIKILLVTVHECNGTDAVDYFSKLCISVLLEITNGRAISPMLEKTDMAFDLRRSPWTFRGYFPMCKRCAASSPFEMNNPDLVRQREDRILVAEEDIPQEIQKHHLQHSLFN
jgi:hypothetical protein